MALIEGDLESGLTSSDDEGGSSFPGGSQGKKKTLSRSPSGYLNLNRPVRDSRGLPMRDSSEDTRDCFGEPIQLLVEGNAGGGEERQQLVALAEEKNKSKDQKKKHHNSKKPPRPPKGPILSASDVRLVREISELAAKRRARVERMKTSRRAAKGSTWWSGNLTALAITILFFVVVVLQGLFSRHVGFQGSPEPAVSTEGLISIQFYSHSPSNELVNEGPFISRPPSYQEQVPRAEEGKDVG